MSAVSQAPTSQPRLSAAEFARQYGGAQVDLVDGVVQETPVPQQRHGKISYRVAAAIGGFVDAGDLGHITINDSFVQTASDPDRVRGDDLCYFSYERLAKGPMPDGLVPVSPNLVVEIRSPSERWNSVFTKVGEYLTVGVQAVIVVDETTLSVSVYRNDEFQQIFDNGDELTIPDILPGFSIPVRKLFE